MTLGGSNSIESTQLKSFVERIEHVESEIGALNDDKKDIYAEMRGVGYDPKIVRKVIARRKKDPDKLREEDELVDLYARALGGTA